MTSSVAGRRSSKALLKAILAPKKVMVKYKKRGRKKVMVPVWWSAACLIHYNFLNRGETIHYIWAQQIHEMHRKLQCLQAALANWKGPILHNTRPHTLHNQRFKSWTNWATKFCLIHHTHLPSHQLTTTSSSTSTTFCRENASTTSMRQKVLSPRVHPILKYGFLCYRNRQNLFITGKNVLTVMVPILINKDVFEPSYNDLKFMV